jgi:CRISPR-associated protein Cas5d
VLEVWGELACFSRPEAKVERFSYEVPTPSAARGIFDAIYWKNKFHWQVTKIEVLKPIRYITLRRNEVKDKVSASSVASWMSGKSEPVPIYADGDKDLLGTDMKGRTQRQTIALKDVAYRLHARVVPHSANEDIVPIEAQFKRRARAGQCFQQPYLGCREFPAYFRLIEEESPDPPHPADIDIGLMLYDVFDLSRPGNSSNTPSISLFDAKVRKGVLMVPDYGSAEVLNAMEVEKC